MLVFFLMTVATLEISRYTIHAHSMHLCVIYDFQHLLISLHIFFSKRLTTYTGKLRYHSYPSTWWHPVVKWGISPASPNRIFPTSFPPIALSTSYRTLSLSNCYLSRSRARSSDREEVCTTCVDSRLFRTSRDRCARANACFLCCVVCANFPNHRTYRVKNFEWWRIGHFSAYLCLWFRIEYLLPVGLVEIWD